VNLDIRACNSMLVWAAEFELNYFVMYCIWGKTIMFKLKPG